MTSLPYDRSTRPKQTNPMNDASDCDNCWRFVDKECKVYGIKVKKEARVRPKVGCTYFDRVF